MAIVVDDSLRADLLIVAKLLVSNTCKMSSSLHVCIQVKAIAWELLPSPQGMQPPHDTQSALTANRPADLYSQAVSQASALLSQHCMDGSIPSLHVLQYMDAALKSVCGLQSDFGHWSPTNQGAAADAVLDVLQVVCGTAACGFRLSMPALHALMQHPGLLQKIGKASGKQEAQPAASAISAPKEGSIKSTSTSSSTSSCTLSPEQALALLQALVFHTSSPAYPSVAARLHAASAETSAASAVEAEASTLHTAAQAGYSIACPPWLQYMMLPALACMEARQLPSAAGCIAQLACNSMTVAFARNPSNAGDALKPDSMHTPSGVQYNKHAVSAAVMSQSAWTTWHVLLERATEQACRYCLHVTPPLWGGSRFYPDMQAIGEAILACRELDDMLRSKVVLGQLTQTSFSASEHANEIFVWRARR